MHNAEDDAATVTSLLPAASQHDCDSVTIIADLHRQHQCTARQTLRMGQMAKHPCSTKQAQYLTCVDSIMVLHAGLCIWVR